MKTKTQKSIAGTGAADMMEVRQDSDGKYRIMHKSNSAIIYYGDGSKYDAERVLKLWSEATTDHLTFDNSALTYLSKVYVEWLKDQKLADLEEAAGDAMEFAYCGYDKMTPRQRKWLALFIQLWEKTEELENGK